MRVLTLNILGRLAAWPQRREPLAAVLHGIGPDLVLLQESVVDDVHDQSADLLGPEFHMVHQAVRAPDGSGMTIASRWPLEAAAELDLRTGDFPAGALAVDLHWPEAPVPLLVVTHKPSWQADAEDERRSQAAAVIRLVEATVARTGQAVLLGGDLDAPPTAPSVALIRASFRDLWHEHHGDQPGPTFAPSVNPLIDEDRQGDRRIDYLFVRDGHSGPSLSARLCERVFTEPVQDVWVSDHFGLVADIDVEPA